jgi:chromosome partitioning protein
VNSPNGTATTGVHRPHVIVIGNEKGGTGKSTTAMHVIVGMLKLGYRVGSIDVDGRQGTLSTYLDNRTVYAQRHGLTLIMPEHRRITAAEEEIRDHETADEGARFIKALSDLARQQVIVIDTPGSESHLARLAHGEADTLITPLNDSFLDIDVLAKVDRERRAVHAPSVYTQMVWEQNNRRVVEGRAPIDWVVMRNRMTHIDARNKRDIVSLLDKLAARIGFRLAPGFGERMVYRELFLKGLTLLDILPGEEGHMESPSHAAARQEVTELLAAIGVPVPA